MATEQVASFEFSNANAPPPDYHNYADQSRPPPFNPERTGGTLRNALLAMESMFLSQENVPNHYRAGSLRPRMDPNTYYQIVADEDSVPSNPSRGRDRLRRTARSFGNTLTLRGNRSHIRQRRSADTTPSREEVMETLPSFWPICTIIITIVQIILFVAICVYFGLAPISFNPKREFASCLTEFADETCKSVTKEVPPNFFIGPSISALIHVGAQYSPCMRDNVEFRIQAARKRNDELSLRCCLAECGYNECGMIPLDSCLNEGGGNCRDILGGASVCRNESQVPVRCNVTLHPCCVGSLGDCIVTSEENCTFQNGYYHPDKAVCSDIGEGCFDDICKYTWSPGLNGWQGFRFLSAMFLHRGVIDLLILMLAQLYIGCSIERRIGWLRVFLIYIISGVGGLVTSGIFIPDTVSVGASGSLFGLLGVQLVELLQGWKWVKKPITELVKLLIFDIVLLALGTLPYIDNFANIGGFIFGTLSAFILVPYISIGKWDRVKKFTIITITLPLLGFLFLVGFFFFYVLPNPNFCSWCSYINCIPYTSTFCEDFLGNIQRIVPTIPG